MKKAALVRFTKWYRRRRSAALPLTARSSLRMEWTRHSTIFWVNPFHSPGCAVHLRHAREPFGQCGREPGDLPVGHATVPFGLDSHAPSAFFHLHKVFVMPHMFVRSERTLPGSPAHVLDQFPVSSASDPFLPLLTVR
jgi:hypothetical protein